MKDNKLDFMSLTETWLNDSGSMILLKMLLKMTDSCILYGQGMRGQGVACMYSGDFINKTLSVFAPFEYVALSFVCDTSVLLGNIYRLPTHYTVLCNVE